MLARTRLRSAPLRVLSSGSVIAGVLGLAGALWPHAAVGQPAPAAAAAAPPSASAAGPVASPVKLPADLRPDEVRCSPDDCAIGACILRGLMNDPMQQLGSVRIVPNMENGQVQGFRIFAIRPDSLLAQIGFQNGDVLVAVNGKPMTNPSEALEAYSSLTSADSLTLTLLRGGTKLSRRVVIDRRPLREGVCPQTAPAPPPPPPPRPTAESQSAEMRVIAKDLRCQGLSCKVHRGTVTRILENASLLSSSARLVPDIKDGQPQGFKIFAVRPGSLLALLGLRNNDSLRRVNEFKLSSPDQALQAYASVRKTDSLAVEFERAGKPLTLAIQILP